MTDKPIIVSSDVASRGSATPGKPDNADLERALELIQATISGFDLSDADRKILIGLAGVVEASITKARERNYSRFALINSIEDTILRRRFRVVHQPIVELSSGVTVGFEALSRFLDADPNRWFADAGDVGLRVALELCAMGEALHGYASEMLPGTSFLSVNASPTAVMSPLLSAALEGADLSRLVVELTEDTLIEDLDALRAVLSPLRKRGLRLAVDDTGTGYASLKVLLQLKPDLIKFDRFFVSGIEDDPARRALFAASVDFANATGGRVVAEGVETPEQLRVLKHLGVHLAQGYLLGRPSENL